MPRNGRLLPVALALGSLALFPGTADAGKRTVPEGFYSMNLEAQLLKAPASRLDPQFGRMAAAGAESVRTVFNWAAAQRVKGAPPTFARTDRLVSLAAAHGLEILPTVLYTPRWARVHPRRNGSPPARNSDYTAYLNALVARYGPRGTFWDTHPELPRLPIRAWQIWNEPHFGDFWDASNWEKGYGSLLRASYAALKRDDPQSTVVLAGLTGGVWDLLRSLYAHGGVRRSFDVVAINPFTRHPWGLPRIVRRVRAVMTAHGDGAKPVWLTEIAWSASKGVFEPPDSVLGIQVPPGALGVKVSKAYSTLAAARADPSTRVDRVYWFSWSSDYDARVSNPSVFHFSGLVRYPVAADTGALAAYRASARRYEGCRKTTRAVCAR